MRFELSRCFVVIVLNYGLWKSLKYFQTSKYLIPKQWHWLNFHFFFKKTLVRTWSNGKVCLFIFRCCCCEIMLGRACWSVEKQWEGVGPETCHLRPEETSEHSNIIPLFYFTSERTKPREAVGFLQVCSGSVAEQALNLRPVA